MKRVLGILVAASLCTTGVASVALAQQGQDLRSQHLRNETLIMKERLIQAQEGAPLPLPPGADFVFVASENLSGKIVKGAPYSAEAITESVQTLADGNRIVNRFTSQLYRDSEGRTRREQTLKGLGVVGTGEGPLSAIFINDPVAGINYSLDTRSRTAHKSVPLRFQLTSKSGTLVEGQRFEIKTGEATATANVIVTTTPPSPGQAGTRVPPPPELLQQVGVSTAGGATAFAIRTKQGPGNEVKEQLGKQMIEGVEAEGTRTTVTIPAGEIGNDRPIEIVSERWYSPELQLVVMTRHTDPRSGETTYKLTNINRAEPSKSLFEVPPGFTVTEMKPGLPSIAPLPRKKPANQE